MDRLLDPKISAGVLFDFLDRATLCNVSAVNRQHLNDYRARCFDVDKLWGPRGELFVTNGVPPGCETQLRERIFDMYYGISKHSNVILANLWVTSPLKPAFLIGLLTDGRYLYSEGRQGRGRYLKHPHKSLQDAKTKLTPKDTVILSLRLRVEPKWPADRDMGGKFEFTMP